MSPSSRPTSSCCSGCCQMTTIAMTGHPCLSRSCSATALHTSPLPPSTCRTTGNTSSNATTMHTVSCTSPTQKRQRSHQQPTLAFAASAVPIPLTPLRSTLTNIVVGTTAAIAGVVLGQLSSAAPDSGTGGQPPCERCNGSGYVDCDVCKRWDNSAISKLSEKQGNNKSATVKKERCSSCNGSHRTRCPWCRGGGTSVPVLGRLPIPVRIDDGYNSMRRFAMFMP